MSTEQVRRWQGDFGKDYTDRNPQSVEALDELYEKSFGVRRSELNQQFLGDLDRDIAILEVGSNVGAQLMALQQMGFSNLTGVEIQHYAIERARTFLQNTTFLQANVFNLPFPNKSFDLVYTSGVLIHICPTDIRRALSEIHRCSRRFIWGWEYFADNYTEIPYHGRDAMMWKTNFAKLYTDRFQDLSLVKEKRIPYVDSDNVDAMFLLEKKGSSI